MTQADGRHNLKRIFLVLPGWGEYNFMVNPENYQMDMPQRSTVIKTKSDIIIEDYGKDVQTISFSGTTGFKNGRGKAKLDELYAGLEGYAQTSEHGSRSATPITLYNATDDVSYKVHLAPQSFKYSRSVNEPLLYRYEIVFIVIGYASDPDRDALVDTEIGNTNNSTKTDAERRVENLNTEAQQARLTNTVMTTDTGIKPGGGRGGASTYLNNPRVNTNGALDAINSLALIIGYSNGGVDV